MATELDPRACSQPCQHTRGIVDCTGTNAMVRSIYEEQLTSASAPIASVISFSIENDCLFLGLPSGFDATGASVGAGATVPATPVTAGAAAVMFIFCSIGGADGAGGTGGSACIIGEQLTAGTTPTRRTDHLVFTQSFGGRFKSFLRVQTEALVLGVLNDYCTQVARDKPRFLYR